MLTKHGPRGDQINQIVQLTDQSIHRAVGVAAALVTTWITLRKGDRR
jgi:hypothetical protein